MTIIARLGLPSGVRRPLPLLLICAAVVLSAWPALLGIPLVDDLQIVPMRRPAPPPDVFAAARRWQPAVGLSLRATAAVAPRSFTGRVLLHHLTSLALHLLAVWLLLRLARALHPDDPTPHPWHVFAVAAFALHPSLVESFGHLAARGEGIGVVALAALALSLQRARLAPAVGFTLLGMAASPGLAPAAVALGLAAALDAPSAPTRRAAAAVSLVAVGAALLTFGAPPSAAALARWAARAPGAVAVATRALLVPTETALRLPQWELSRPLTPDAALTAALPLVAAAWLWLRGARARAVLLVGAVLSVLPLALRADSLAFGLDRYLSPAAVLVTTAVLRAPPPAWIASLSPSARRLVGGSAVGLLLLLGFMSRQTATGFRSDAHQLDAMMQMRPRDPSGHLRNSWFAAQTGDRATATRSLRTALRGELTPRMREVADRIAAGLARR